jgi:hypothetical protein
MINVAANSQKNTVVFLLIIFVLAFLTGCGNGKSAPAVNTTQLTPSSISVGTAPSMVVSKFTRGGNTDLLVSGSSILLGKGDGTFTKASIPGSGQVMAAGDFDHDGLTDVAVAVNQNNNTSTLVTVLLNNGDGTFRQGSLTATQAGVVAMTAGNFRGNGLIDLAVVTYMANGSVNTPGAVQILLNNGDGTFSFGSTVNVGRMPTAIAMGDFNHDGVLDLAVTNQLDAPVSILLGKGDGTFTAQSVSAQNNDPFAVAVGDFNGDGIPDLVLANDLDSVDVLIGKGDGTFSSQAHLTGSRTHSVAVGDFNGDGKLDIAVADMAANFVVIYINNGDGTFTAKTRYAVPSGSSVVAVGDFNGDGKPDLAVGGNNGVTILLGNGDGSFVQK